MNHRTIAGVMLAAAFIVPATMPLFVAADALSDLRTEVQLLQQLLTLQQQVLSAITTAMSQVQSTGGGATYGGTTYAPTCTMSFNPSTVSSGQSAALTWNAYNAVSATVTSVGTVPLSGTQTIYPTPGSTYIMTVTGANGQTNTCQAAIGGVQGNQGNGNLTVSPTAGTAPLSVQFVARLNTASSCVSGSQFIDFGDGTNTTIPYTANTCQAFSYSLQHTYSGSNVYTATLYGGPGAGTGIVGTAVVSTNNTSNNGSSSLVVYSSTTSSHNPTVNGTAISTAYPVTVTINGYTYTATVSPSDLTWQVYLGNTLPSGTYTITATSNGSSASGTLTIL